MSGFGAIPGPRGVEFRVWAPDAQQVEVVLENAGQVSAAVPMRRHADGVFGAVVEAARPGSRYRYRLDDRQPMPDPASRYQPAGVHGPSEVIDPSAYRWSDQGWAGRAPTELVIYELHVGTFTDAGTFAAAAQRLSYLAELGVTAVELMPVADFAGDRNWGYDGVAWFAPARCYGRPDDLRALVDRAHELGLAVLLDVVYNHAGPDGAYIGAFASAFFSTRHTSPWGPAVNLDGPASRVVRDWLIDNARHWVREYHIDGLRLDATHALVDDGPRHFLEELSTDVRAAAAPPRPILIAEDSRNLATIARPVSEGGWGLDGIWADDFHHQVRRLLAGDTEGYYEDFTGTTADLATTVRQGWFYTGQPSRHWAGPRGTEPRGLKPSQFVVCVQNHDQIGNRALGERLHHQIDLPAYRAASALLLCLPQTPLLFMGQEWAAASPFLFFTDHHADLGALVTEGRRTEFAAFSAFADPEARTRIPDPQALETFTRSRLDWSEVEAEPHASTLRLYRAVLRLRATLPALGAGEDAAFEVQALDADTIALARRRSGAAPVLVVARLRGKGTVDLTESGSAPAQPGGRAWRVVLTTEDESFCPDPAPPRVESNPTAVRLHFARPTTVLLTAEASADGGRA